jgi:hypothetical protein
MMAREINSRIKQIKKVVDPLNMAQEAYKVFVANTPIKTGNARQNTNLVQDTIEADYAYAQRLNTGYSKQNPNGMTKPTIAFLQDYLKKNLGK